MSAIGAMADQVPVEDQSGYTGGLQQELEGHFGHPSMSRISSRVRRNTAKCPVSNAVRDGTKLQ